MHDVTVDRRGLLRLAGLTAAGSVIASAGFAPEAQAASAVRATGDVWIRSGPGLASRGIAVLRRGQSLPTAGAVRNGRWQPVRYQGRVGYISNRYLRAASMASASAAAPRSLAATGAGFASLPAAKSVSMPSGVTSRARGIAQQVRSNFPQVATMPGARNEAGSDHNTGRAVDIMLPGNYRLAPQQALGQAIADHMVANASALGISYVIWNQHIWNIARASEGWRRQSDRGSDNANHRNHVHVSVR